MHQIMPIMITMMIKMMMIPMMTKYNFYDRMIVIAIKKINFKENFITSENQTRK